MATKIFLNLPVQDLARSIAFFTKLGYSFNQDFADASSTCMIVADNIFVMLLTHEKFKMFTPREISDPRKNSQVLVTLSCDSRAEVDEMVKKAVAAGGKTFEKAEDYGLMYSHSYEDLDGHLWGLVWMDPNFKPHG